MDTGELADRLSQIRTHWSAIFDAHRDQPGTSEARNQLIQRYMGAVFRYILGAVRDPEAAEDLCQEFAVRFLRGDLRGADPDRGRFRDYVRAVLINLVNDAHRARQANPVRLCEETVRPTVDTSVGSHDPTDFAATWREELIAKTWETLRQENSTYHAVLWLRVEEPDLTSAAMAQRLSAQMSKPISPDHVRKSLERAHAKFAQLLFDEVGISLRTADCDAIEAELRSLDLLRYCRSAWERRKKKSP